MWWLTQLVIIIVASIVPILLCDLIDWLIDSGIVDWGHYWWPSDRVTLLLIGHYWIIIIDIIISIDDWWPNY